MSYESSKAEDHKGKGKVKEGRKSYEKSNTEKKGKGNENKSSEKGKGKTIDALFHERYRW
uniref:Uncharacterized protein n=1 Tax=Oryza barthii TaxID=65489 RepID=A0A0D3F2A0_9ORYZ